jgi:predicted alpha-1,2-mannosidase
MAVALAWASSAGAAGVCDAVDPFIGTADGGQMYPGPAAPFGLIHLSPDTGLRPGGYDSDEPALLGFSLTHLNGIGCAHGEDFRFQALTAAPAGAPRGPHGAAPWPLDHRRERAAPGCYQVDLAPGPRVALAAGLRVALAQVDWPAGGDAILQFDAASNANGVLACGLHFDPAHRRLDGWARARGVCGSPLTVTAYFAGELDQPFTVGGLWVGNRRVSAGAGADGFDVSGWVRVSGARSAHLRLALSYTSVEGARRNLAAEAPGWDGDALAARTRARWEALLGQVRVQGGHPVQRRLLYTGLYHVFLQPGVFDDADGRYRGFDGRIHQLSAGQHQFSDFSLWDTYRIPPLWLAWLAPEEAGQMAASLLRDADQGGALPLWTYANGAVDTMVPYPAPAFLAALQAFGAAVDGPKVLRLARQALEQGAHCGPDAGWRGGAAWARRGWLAPSDGTGSPLARSIEYAQAAGALQALALRLGQAGDATFWGRLAASWKQCWDPASGLPRQRDAQGAWASAADPASTAGLVEGTAAQYAFSAPQDLGGLIALGGGPGAARERLDRLFSAILGAGWQDQQPFFWAGNEVDLQVPWVWDWLGEPGQARATLSRVLDEAWSDERNGWPGNDDSGTLGAWVACALTGVYPMRPGVAGVALHEPFFRSVEVGPPGHARLAIDAAEARPRWPRPWLNGRALPAAWMGLDPRPGAAARVQWMDGAGPLAPPR